MIGRQNDLTVISVKDYIISAKYVNKQAAKEAYPQSFLFATHKAKG